MFDTITDRKKHQLIISIFLTVVTLAVFWQLNRYEFINIEDDKYITENTRIQHGITLDGVRWAFGSTHAQYWQPLTWLSLMLDSQFYSLNAGGYHVTNLILHILSTLLLFWLFNRMTTSVWKSAFVAALFALHPLRVESVAWVAKRRDLLCVFFWMMTLCFYVYYTEKPVIRRYLLVIYSFVFALMSKPMVVTLPVVMILLDFWPLKRFASQKTNWLVWQLREKTPFFILSAVFSFMTIYIRYHLDNTFVNDLSLSSRLANAPVSFVAYLQKFFWPQDFTILLLFPNQIPSQDIIGASLVIIIVSVAVMVAMKSLPYLFVGWIWYVVTILPVLGFIHFGHLAMSDHHSYLPSIGIAMMLAWGIPLLFTNERSRKKILFPTGVVVIITLSMLTWRQCHYWENSCELLNHACLVTKTNYQLLASALAEKGKFEDAIDNYNKAIRISPDIHLHYCGRGLAYDNLHQYQRAIDDYNHAIRLKPDYADVYFLRGNSYDGLGLYQQAIKDYNEAIRLKSNYLEAYNNRGNTYFSKGNNKLGCLDAQKACALGNCRLLEFAKSQKLCR